MVEVENITMSRFVRIGRRTRKKIVYFISCVNQIALKSKRKHFLRAQFPELRNWNGSVEMCVRDATCTPTFVKIDVRIKKLIEGKTNRQNGNTISLSLLFKGSRLASHKTLAHAIKYGRHDKAFHVTHSLNFYT
jgi:hypothetical protein